VEKEEVDIIVNEIRSYHENVPVVFLGGHSHLEQEQIDVDNQIIKMQS
jgi:hypothetical protein